MEKQKPFTKATSAFAFLGSFVASKIFLRLTILWFVVQAIFMAVSTNVGIPPDERIHLGYAQLFVNNGWLPAIHDQSGFYWLGEVKQNPFFLYHYLMSLPLHLFAHSSHAVILLRFINIAFAILSLFVIVRISNLLGFSKLVRNLSLFMLCNTLMFVFLSSSINYDNLFTLVALTFVELTLRLWRTFSFRVFVPYVLVFFTGCFIKVSFLPIALASMVLLMVKIRRRDIKLLPGQFYHFVSTSSRWLLGLYVIMFLIFATLFIQHFAVNAVRYHAITPACDRINTAEQCREDFIYARSEIFRNGQVTKPTISTFQYAATWADVMRRRTIGILGSKNIENTSIISSWSQIMLVVSPLIIVWGLRKKDSLILVLLAVSAFYTLCLFLTNRSTYHNTGVYDLSVQGRYLFPVLPPLLLIVNHYIFGWLKSSFAGLYILVTLVVFISAGLPSYLAYSNRDWYTVKTIPVNNFLHAGFNKVYKTL